MNYKKIICWIKGHRRGKTWMMENHWWHIECKRCKYTIEYTSPRTRLIGEEIRLGFDGQ